MLVCIVQWIAHWNSVDYPKVVGLSLTEAIVCVYIYFQRLFRYRYIKAEIPLVLMGMMNGNAIKKSKTQNKYSSASNTQLQLFHESVTRNKNEWKSLI